MYCELSVSRTAPEGVAAQFQRVGEIARDLQVRSAKYGELANKLREYELDKVGTL